MSKKVVRYDTILVSDRYGQEITEFIEADDGCWVTSSDHDRIVATLQKRIAKLEATLNLYATNTHETSVTYTGYNEFKTDVGQQAREALKHD